NCPDCKCFYKMSRLSLILLAYKYVRFKLIWTEWHASFCMPFCPKSNLLGIRKIPARANAPEAELYFDAIQRFLTA
ncbi:MAG: hypothetical protein Q8R24_04155, partial [Legionellaceae bacterium]|nr:hypothetical protein [Legionellaceae bacterium]